MKNGKFYVIKLWFYGQNQTDMIWWCISFHEWKFQPFKVIKINVFEVLRSREILNQAHVTLTRCTLHDWCSIHTSMKGVNLSIHLALVIYVAFNGSKPPWGGVTKPIFSVPLFSQFFRIMKTVVTLMISSSYLAGVTTAELRKHLANMNMIENI